MIIFVIEHCVIYNSLFCFFSPLVFGNRMILKYLIPVKLSIGILPKNWLLEKYNLIEVWLPSVSHML